MMASSSIANPDAGSTRSRESKRSRKRRKIDSAGAAGDNLAASSINQISNWRTESEQQIYSTKLLDALRHRPSTTTAETPATTGRAVRETADRVLATTAKGRTRWSRAILTNRLSLRLNQINRKHKKAGRKSGNSSNSRLRKGTRNISKKMPVLQKKVKVLGRLVPGCRKLSFPNLLEEATDYIAALEMQVRAMTVLTSLLTGSTTGLVEQSN